MSPNEMIESAAARLRAAETARIPCAPVREIIGTEDLGAAYRVQKINTSHKIKSGGRVIGHKIGLTAPVVQKQLGVDQPDYGLLWHDKEILTGGEISVAELMQPKAEAEIAFVLGKDLDKEFITSVDALNAVAYALASIEVVGSRISGWDIKITDTIADNASASHWVVGHRPVPLRHLDLVNCKMRMENNGKVVAEGVGSACLGSPLNALLWLARKMVHMGEPLQAGDLILSGAVGPMVNVVAGDNFNVVIEGLGSVSASFTE